MQEGNRSDHFLCHLPLPLFCFLCRYQKCHAVPTLLAIKIPGLSGQEPKMTSRPSHLVLSSWPHRALGMRLVLLLGNASAQCLLKQKSHCPQDCNLKCHSEMFCACGSRGELVSASCGIALKGCFVCSETLYPLQSWRSVQQLLNQCCHQQKKMLNDAELSSLSHSCLTCLGASETPVSPPPIAL